MHFDFNLYINKFNNLLSLRDLTANTIKSYNSMLRCYLSWLDENLSLKPEEISLGQLQPYLFYLKDIKKISPRSINAHISQLRFLYLYVLHLPFNKYEVPYMKFNTTLPEILTKEEACYFIDTMTNLKHKAMVALLYSSGLRVTEVRHLRYQDVDRKNLRLYITPSKSRCDRYAILSTKALNILTDYWYTFDKPMGFLFPGMKPDAPVVSNTVSRSIANHAAFLGFHKHLYSHIFRHSFGTHLYEQGYDLLTIQKLLGHKCATSSLIYVHLGAKTMSSLISPFDFEGGL